MKTAGSSSGKRAWRVRSAAVLVVLSCFGCSSHTDLGANRGDDGGGLDGGAGASTGAGGANGGAGGKPSGGAATGGHAGAAHTGGPDDAGAGGARSLEGGTGAADASRGPVVPVAAAEFQAGLVHAVCDNVQTCCTASHRGYDAIHCRQTVIQSFVVPLSDTMLAYDSTEAGRCVQAVTRAATACEAVDVTTCYDAFIGNQPPGAACASGFECARGPGGYAVCGQDGTCAQPRRGALGESCDYSCIDGKDGTTRCSSVLFGATNRPQVACHSANGLVCVPGSTTATCQPSSSDCKQNPTSSCPAGQTCDVSADRCYAAVPLGASCASAHCGLDAYCASGVCAALKPVDATCTLDSECQSSKCEQSFCVPYSKGAADWCGALLTP